jgi:hypothetical protein
MTRQSAACAAGPVCLGKTLVGARSLNTLTFKYIGPHQDCQAFHNLLAFVRCEA